MAAKRIRIGDRLTDFLTTDVTVSRLLAGGFGTLAIGHDRVLGQMVALKSVRPEFWNEQQIQQAFTTEALYVAGIPPHPNIINVYGVVDIDGVPFIKEEYAEGGSLRSTLVSGTIPFAQGLYWAQQIAAGLVLLHRPDPAHWRAYPLVHRDLKPDNILLSPPQSPILNTLTGTLTGALTVGTHFAGTIRGLPGQNKWLLKLTDFGLAALSTRLASSGDRYPSPGQETGTNDGASVAPSVDGESSREREIIGTPAYMSPERWQVGSPITTATDMYAFGVILSELLTGERPLLDEHRGHSIQEWRDAHMSGTPRSLTPLQPETSPAVEALYQACLAKDPRQRPTAGEAFNTLRDAILARGEPPYDPEEVRQQHASIWLGAVGIASDAGQDHGTSETDGGLSASARAETKPPSVEEIAFWINWARSYENFGRFDEAIRRLEHVNAMAPTTADVITALASAYQRVGRVDDALAVYQQLPDSKRGDTVAKLLLLGNLLRDIGEYAQAESAYAQALETDQESAPVWYDRSDNEHAWGRRLMDNGAVDAARIHFETSVRYYMEGTRLGPGLPRATPLRQSEIQTGMRNNRLAGRPPLAGVAVRARGELLWVLRSQKWSTTANAEERDRPKLGEVDFTGANLIGVNLRGAELRQAQLMGAQLAGADLVKVSLENADLSKADLTGANLTNASLVGAIVHGASLRDSILHDADLRGISLVGVDMRRAQFNDGSKLSGATFGDDTLLAGVRWAGVALDGIEWNHVPRLGDEVLIRKERGVKRLSAYRDARRAYRNLTLALKAQGFTDAASMYRVRELHVLRSELVARRNIPGALLYWILDILAGYGERSGRALIAYVIVIFGFATAYFAFGHGTNVFPYPVDALVFSVTSFHGRGFFPSESLTLHDPITILAAIEAVIGLFIELVFIATFGKRFLGD